MTIELVDGHGGKPHISGEDLGDFKAGILGNDGYVFNRANKLSATLNGSNSVTIATGSGILPNSGRHFRVTSPETLTITSGTQGQNRNDLCVVRASTSDDGTTVENAQLLILRGTPTSGTASDPKTQAGDLVLYRFQLTGVSVAAPIALFSVMVPYNEFRDSIYQSKKYSKTITIRAGATGDFSAILDKPDGYMPIGVTQISTGQAAWSLIQFEVNVNTNSMIASFHSYDSSTRTATVTMSIAFIKVN